VFDFSNPETFWLNVTNLALGLVTLVCALVIGKAIWDGVRQRARARVAAPVIEDDHAFLVPGLGLTMADGGQVRKQGDVADDPANIARSNN
jgi:hypothetical protein